jgi:hypothetical protein
VGRRSARGAPISSETTGTHLRKAEIQSAGVEPAD